LYVFQEESALHRNATIYKYNPNKQEKHDVILTTQGKRKKSINQIKKQQRIHRGIKWFICVKVRMVKTTPEGQQEIDAHFRSMNFTTTNPNSVDEDYNRAIDKIKSSILEYQRLGSGWLIDEVSFSLCLSV